MSSAIKYNAAAYARASKDDTDSSTIENQTGLIRDYVKSMPDIRIVSVREDNGYSGVDFLRPSFADMMKDIEAGNINCVIVKDLSRLGRNYIEVGELIDTVFPRLNVRLIAINDHYDSNNPQNDFDDIIIPFKNLINEQYLRDFSVKIRSHLNVKRKNGEYVAAFAPYGYKRDGNDRHKLVIDEHAAAVVRDIFRLKIEGKSQQKIADRLNLIGEPSPAEYKKRDTNYTAQFQTHAHSSWSAVAVGRILHNQVYIGKLIQGKQTTPSYKVKKRIVKPEDEWDVTQDAHEPIISNSDYETVNGLLLQDTRTSPVKDTVYPLSGIMFCGDCGFNMVRKKAGKNNYYTCATSKAVKGCTSHYFRRDRLEFAVFEAIRHQVAYVLDIEKSLKYVQSLPYQQRNMLNLSKKIKDREHEIRICERYRRSAYEDFKSGVISREDFSAFSKDYTERIDALGKAVAMLKHEMELLSANNTTSHIWIEHFTQYKNVAELSRELVVNLIERIDVYEGKRMTIRFRYQDRLEKSREILNGLVLQATGGSNGKNKQKTGKCQESAN